MTVAELIKVLNEKNPDAVVHVGLEGLEGIEGEISYPMSEVIDLSDWMQVPADDDVVIVGR